MASDWKNNRIVVVLLVLAVAGIWGTVAYRLVSGVSPPDAPTPQASGTVDVGDVARVDVPTPQRYRGRFRDPFEHRLAPDTPTPSPSQPEAPEPEPEPKAPPPPPLRSLLQLVGIFDDTVLLRNANTSQIHIVDDGAAVDSVTVREISSSSVVISTDTRTDTLRLER